jgi:hypothetical protein
MEMCCGVRLGKTILRANCGCISDSSVFSLADVSDRFVCRVGSTSLKLKGIIARYDAPGIVGHIFLQARL